MAYLANMAGCVWSAEVDEYGRSVSPWHFLGENYTLGVQFNYEEPTTIMGNTCESYGKVINTKPNPGSPSGSMTLHEYTATNVALAVNGKVEQASRAAETLTDVSVALFDLNEWSYVGYDDLENVVVRDAGGDELVEGTDYKLKPGPGLIKPLTAAVANTTVTVSGNAVATTATRVRIGVGGNKRHAIKIVSVNKFNESRVTTYLRRVLITPNGEVNLISDLETEHESFPLNLALEIPTGQSDYGYIDGLPVAAE